GLKLLVGGLLLLDHGLQVLSGRRQLLLQTLGLALRRYALPPLGRFGVPGCARLLRQALGRRRGLLEEDEEVGVVRAVPLDGNDLYSPRPIPTVGLDAQPLSPARHVFSLGLVEGATDRH